MFQSYHLDAHSESFGVVLRGSVANVRGNISKELPVSSKLLDTVEAGQIRSFLSAGGIFGYVDFLLGANRTFSTVASEDGTIVAKVTRRGMDRLQEEYPETARIVEKALLQSSVMELANCTCHE